MIRACVERIADSFAICESLSSNGKFDIKKDRLPENVREGDIIKIFEDRIIIDTEETAKRRKKLFQLQSKILRNKEM